MALERMEEDLWKKTRLNISCIGQMSSAGFMSAGRYFEHWSQEVSGWSNLILKMNFPDTKFTGVRGEGGE